MSEQPTNQNMAPDMYPHELGGPVTADQVSEHLALNPGMYHEDLDPHLEANGIAVDRSAEQSDAVQVLEMAAVVEAEAVQSHNWSELPSVNERHASEHDAIGRALDPSYDERPEGAKRAIDVAGELGSGAESGTVALETQVQKPEVEVPELSEREQRITAQIAALRVRDPNGENPGIQSNIVRMSSALKSGEANRARTQEAAALVAKGQRISTVIQAKVNSRTEQGPETPAQAALTRAEAVSDTIKELAIETTPLGVEEYKALLPHLEAVTLDTRRAILAGKGEGLNTEQRISMLRKLLDCQTGMDALHFGGDTQALQVAAYAQGQSRTEGSFRKPDQSGRVDYLESLVETDEDVVYDSPDPQTIAPQLHKKGVTEVLDALQGLAKDCAKNQTENIPLRMLANIKNKPKAAESLYHVGKTVYGRNMLKWSADSAIDADVAHVATDEELFAQMAELSYKEPPEAFNYLDDTRTNDVENMVLSDKMGLSPGLVSRMKAAIRSRSTSSGGNRNAITLTEVLEYDPKQLETLYENFGIVNVNRYSTEQLDRMGKLAAGDPETLEKLQASKKVRLVLLDSVDHNTAMHYEPKNIEETSSDDTEIIFAEISHPYGPYLQLARLGKMGIKPSSVYLGVHAHPGRFDIGIEGHKVLQSDLGGTKSPRPQNGAERDERSNIQRLADEYMQTDENGEKHVVFLACSLAKPAEGSEQSFVEEVADKTGATTWGAAKKAIIMKTTDGDLSYGTGGMANRFEKDANGKVVRTLHETINPATPDEVRRAA